MVEQSLSLFLDWPELLAKDNVEDDSSRRERRKKERKGRRPLAGSESTLSHHTLIKAP